jgi:3-phosphoshikimate 1-carboxyvinyltransferase
MPDSSLDHNASIGSSHGGEPIRDFTQKADMEARSPWATLTGVREVAITPLQRPVQAHLAIPGSKSFTNRALVIAALAHGPSEVRGILRSDDSYWCIDSLKKLGVRVRVEEDVAKIEGTGGEWPVHAAGLYVGAAGTSARFLPGALAVSRHGSWLLRGSRRLSERPLKPLLDALTELGADIRCLERPGHLPLSIQGRGLAGGRAHISGSVSSQFLSGLLLASPYAKEPVEIVVTDDIVQHAYVWITLDLMREFGVEVEVADDFRRFHVRPQHYQGRAIQLEADASTACYFFSIAALSGGQVRVTNLTRRTRQPDVQFVEVLARMGCRVEYGDTFIEVTGAPTLKGGFSVNMKEMSDQTLTLAAVSVFADAPITVTDVAHIRHHESDRIQAACESLRRLGITVEERDDGFTVHPGRPRPACLDAYDDHRVAMSLALIGTRVPGVRILDPGCVSKTCPTYFDLLQEIGVGVEFKSEVV